MHSNKKTNSVATIIVLNRLSRHRDITVTAYIAKNMHLFCNLVSITAYILEYMANYYFLLIKLLQGELNLMTKYILFHSET